MDPSTSINQEQEQSIDCSHPHSLPQSPSPSPENPKDNPPLAEFAIDNEMVNFPVNPRPFVVGDLLVDHVWNCPARGRVALSGEATREHEDYAIITINPMSEEVNQLRPTLNLVREFLEHDQHVHFTIAHLLPLGLGLV